jgi:hypothetical protein
VGSNPAAGTKAKMNLLLQIQYDKLTLLADYIVAKQKYNIIKYRGVAQLAEQRSPKPQVAGSNPVTPANLGN